MTMTQIKAADFQSSRAGRVFSNCDHAKNVEEWELSLTCHGIATKGGSLSGDFRIDCYVCHVDVKAALW